MEVGCCFKGQHFCWTIQEAFDFFSIPIEKHMDFSAQKEKHNMKEQKKNRFPVVLVGTSWATAALGFGGFQVLKKFPK